MKKTYILTCLLLIVPAVQAGGVTVVLDAGETLEGVTAPTGANWTQQIHAGHLVVTITGASPGPVIVESDENGTTRVRAAYLPADPPSLEALIAQVAALNASQAQAAQNATDTATAFAIVALDRHADLVAQLNMAKNQLASLESKLEGALARIRDLQNGTGTVSGQIQTLSGDLATHHDETQPPEPHSNAAVLVLLGVLIVGLVAREARAYWMNRRQGGGQDLPAGGVAFETGDEE